MTFSVVGRDATVSAVNDLAAGDTIDGLRDLQPLFATVYQQVTEITKLTTIR